MFGVHCSETLIEMFLHAPDTIYIYMHVSFRTHLDGHHKYDAAILISFDCLISIHLVYQKISVLDEAVQMLEKWG